MNDAAALYAAERHNEPVLFGREWVFPSGETVLAAAGGDTLNPSAHPLGAPQITGTDITVDLMLRQPTRITRMIADLTLQRFIADRVFSSAGGVTGGAVVYDEATENELYLDRDVERVAPGAEFPIVTSERRVPRIASVEKWGGKFYVTDEARDRNDAASFTNEVRKLANTIVRKVNTRAIEVLNDAVTRHAQTTVGNNWATVITHGSTPDPKSKWPHADFAKAQLIADQQELGVTFDLWLLNPKQAHDLRIIYGDDLDDILRDSNISLFASNRVPAGEAFVVAENQPGELRVEQPLASETSREGAPSMRQRTWTQSSVRPVMFVTNPFAVLHFTGLG